MSPRLRTIETLARILMAILFLVSGFSKLSSIEATQAYMEAYGVPGYLIWPAATFEIVGATILFVSRRLRELAVLLAGWCLLTASIFHTNFGDQNQLIHLMKNLTMAGGFLILSQQHSPEGAHMSSTASSDMVLRLLANATDNGVVKEVVAEDATYVSLNYANAALRQIEPWCGTYEKAGPSAVFATFVQVSKCWRIEAFETETVITNGNNVAVFGRFRYVSKTLGKVTESPFALLAKVDPRSSKIVYMQFMEDTFSTAASFAKSGSMVYESTPGKQVTITADSKV